MPQPIETDADELKHLDATPEPKQPGFNELGLGQVILEVPPVVIPEPTHPTQSLGDMYAAIDAAPAEWLPSLLAKVVKKSLKSGAWSNVENLILSVRGFAK